MVRYPIRLEKDDNDTFLVTFPDFPEAHTFGDTKAEAQARAVDALETIIDAYIRDRRRIPAPSTAAGPAVTVPALVATKVQLYEAMRDREVGKAELARRLRVHLPQVDRLLNIRHGSKLDQLEAAAQALGGSLDVTFVPAAPKSTRAVIEKIPSARGRQPVRTRDRMAAASAKRCSVKFAKSPQRPRGRMKKVAAGHPPGRTK